MTTNKTFQAGLILAAIFISISLLLSGCASNQAPAAPLSARMQEIKEKGSLVVGTALTAPFEFRDPKSGNLVGMDIEIANKIAARIGVPIVWKEMAFSDLIPALQDGKVDMVIAGMYITAARQELVDMSDGYVDTGLVIVTRNDNNTISNSDDLKDKIVCVKTGSTGARYVQRLIDEGLTAKVQEYADTPSSLQDLSSSFCDAILNDKINSLEYIKSHPELKVASEVLEPAQIGAAVKKADTELLTFINDTLQQMKTGGELTTLYNTWVLGK